MRERESEIGDVIIFLCYYLLLLYFFLLYRVTDKVEGMKTSLSPVSYPFFCRVYFGNGRLRERRVRHDCLFSSSAVSSSKLHILPVSYQPRGIVVGALEVLPVPGVGGYIWVYEERGSYEG